MTTVQHPAAVALDPIDKIVQLHREYFAGLRKPFEPSALIEVLEKRKPKSALSWACSGLNYLGATEAIPLLKEMADFPIMDVKATAILAVAQLGGRKETPWLIECLSRKGTDKTYVLWALASIADPAALSAVSSWFEPHLRALERKPDSDSTGKVVFAVAYLEQVATGDTKITALLERFKELAPRLQRNVRSELESYTKMFAKG